MFIENLMLRQQPSDGAGDAGTAAGGGTDATPAVTPTDDGATISVPTNGGGASEQTPGFADSIPAEYREKTYIQELLKSADPKTEIWKQFDGLQKKLGERPAASPVPAADAPDEEWAKFYEQTRPKEKTAYVIPELKLEGKEEIAKAVNESVNSDYANAMRDAAYDAGITPKQFAALAEKTNLFSAGVREQQMQAYQAQETDFQEGAKKMFGGDMEKALARGKAALNEFIKDPAQKEYIGTLDNKALLALAVAMNGVHAKYEKEDGAPGGGVPASGAMSEAELNAEQQKLMSLPESRDPFHANHASVRTQIRNITNQIIELRKAQTK